MKVYISGPITGRPGYRERFAEAADMIRSMGHDPVNPCDIGDVVSSLIAAPSWHDYMREDVRALLDCDAIYMLDGWKESRGSAFEFQVAYTVNIPRFNPEQ